MPVKAVKRGGKYRVIEADTGRIAKHKSGTPVDGGGHKTREKAERQSKAINRNS